MSFWEPCFSGCTLDTSWILLSAAFWFLFFWFLDIVEWFISSWGKKFSFFQGCCHKFLDVHLLVWFMTCSNIFSRFWYFYLSPNFSIVPFKSEVYWTFARCTSYAREGGWQFSKVEHEGWRYEGMWAGGQT